MKSDIFSFVASETGYSHIKVNKECEDSSGCYDDEIMHICVIADGHGSDNYPRTDRGSKMAVESALKCVREFISAADSNHFLGDTHNKFLIQLTKSILNNWHQLIEEDVFNDPFSEDELKNVSDKYKQYYLSEDESKRKPEKAYGCTLIVFAVAADYCFGLQIGDGKCVIINDKGEFSEPIPEDEECQLNITTSICDDNAIDEFRFYTSSDIPAAVFLGSDGVEDSFSSLEELHALYRGIISIFTDYGKERVEKEIAEYLPTLSRKGSGDDISIGVIINTVITDKISEILKIDIDLSQNRDDYKNNLKELKSFCSNGYIANDNLCDFNDIDASEWERSHQKMEECALRLSGISKLISTLIQKKNELFKNLRNNDKSNCINDSNDNCEKQDEKEENDINDSSYCDSDALAGSVAKETYIEIYPAEEHKPDEDNTAQSGEKADFNNSEEEDKKKIVDAGDETSWNVDINQW